MALENPDPDKRLVEIQSQNNEKIKSLATGISLSLENSTNEFIALNTSIESAEKSLNKIKVIEGDNLGKIINHLRDKALFFGRPLLMVWFTLNKEHPNLTGAFFFALTAIFGIFFEWTYFSVFGIDIPFYHDFSYYIETSLINPFIIIIIALFLLIIFYPKYVVKGMVKDSFGKSFNLVNITTGRFLIFCLVSIPLLLSSGILMAYSDKGRSPDHRIIVPALKGTNGLFEGNILRGGLDTMYFYVNHLKGNKVLKISRASIICVEKLTEPKICSNSEKDSKIDAEKVQKKLLKIDSVKENFENHKLRTSVDILKIKNDVKKIRSLLDSHTDREPEYFRHYFEGRYNCTLPKDNYRLLELTFGLNKPDTSGSDSLQKGFTRDILNTFLKDKFTDQKKFELNKKLVSIWEAAKITESNIHLYAIGFASKSGLPASNLNLSNSRALVTKKMLETFISELNRSGQIKVSDNLLPFIIEPEELGTYSPVFQHSVAKNKAPKDGTQNQRAIVVKCDLSPNK